MIDFKISKNHKGVSGAISGGFAGFMGAKGALLVKELNQEAQNLENLKKLISEKGGTIKDAKNVLSDNNVPFVYGSELIKLDNLSKTLYSPGNVRFFDYVKHPEFMRALGFTAEQAGNNKKIGFEIAKSLLNIMKDQPCGVLKTGEPFWKLGADFYFKVGITALGGSMPNKASVFLASLISLQNVNEQIPSGNKDI